MLTLNKIKQLKSLHKKKYRRIEKKILLEGYRIIDQAIDANSEINEIWVTKESKNSDIGKRLFEKINKHNITWNITSNRIIRQISDSLNNQGIIALLPIPNYNKLSLIPEKSIYLDGVSDPGNMGTILRTAAWFGIKSIFRSPDCVDPFNSKVVRSAMGAHFYFLHLEKIINEDFWTTLKKSDIEILGANTNGTSIHSLDLQKINKWCLILGGESYGINNSVKQFITTQIAIPGSNTIESLNVSIASGILMSHLS